MTPANQTPFIVMIGNGQDVCPELWHVAAVLARNSMWRVSRSGDVLSCGKKNATVYKVVKQETGKREQQKRSLSEAEVSSINDELKELLHRAVRKRGWRIVRVLATGLYGFLQRDQHGWSNPLSTKIDQMEFADPFEAAKAATRLPKNKGEFLPRYC